LLFVVAATAATNDSDSDRSEQHTTPSPPTLRAAISGNTLLGSERGMAAGKILYSAKSGGPVDTDPNSASFPESEEDMNKPAAPVLRELNPKRQASLSAGMDLASLPAANRRRASVSAACANSNKPYHRTLLDPAFTTVEDVYKEWKDGIFGGVPLSQVDVNTQEWQNDPKMLLQYRIHLTIGKEIDARRLMHPKKLI
jgi:hypothetical protein